MNTRSQKDGSGARPRRETGLSASVEELYDLADFFKTFGDSTRIRILHALHPAELCVQDLASRLSMGPSAVSHQLRVLRAAGLVRCRREGRRAYYGLDDEHVAQIVTQALVHVRERR